MRSRLEAGGAFLLTLVAACSCASNRRLASAPPPGDAVGQPRVVIDFTAVDAWLECAARSSDLRVCATASERTPGGRIAALSVSTFGDGDAPESRPDARSVEALVARMKAWPDALAVAARFIPEPVGGGALRVFVVANGHPWGDAYVRGVESEGEGVKLSAKGEPVILLNAVLISSGYRGDAAEQAASAFGVLSHELFHALFRRYQALTPAWSPLTEDLSPRESLQEIVLDEGVAHFVDREPELVRDGFPRDRGEKALAALGDAWKRLAALPPESAEADELLRSANQGRYWDKYGSIAGMLMAYGTFRVHGVEGIKQAVRCGPGRLLKLYASAVEQAPNLPRLPATLDGTPWVDLCESTATPFPMLHG